jgi:hypothetical protein
MQDAAKQATVLKLGRGHEVRFTVASKAIVASIWVSRRRGLIQKASVSFPFWALRSVAAILTRLADEKEKGLAP